MYKGDRYKIKKNKIKIRKLLLTILVILLLIICAKHIIFGNSKKDEQMELGEIQSQEETEEVSSKNVQTEINEIEEYAILTEESSNLKTYVISEEDSDIKAYIENVMNKNELSGENFGFFYYNVDIQSYYFYNEDKWFTAGSTIKVAIAMMYYDQINNGEITENTTYQYYSSDYEEGDGLTAYTYNVGDNIPLSFLLEQMIVNSDNTATNILISGLRYKVYI